MKENVGLEADLPRNYLIRFTILAFSCPRLYPEFYDMESEGLLKLLLAEVYV